VLASPGLRPMASQLGTKQVPFPAAGESCRRVPGPGGQTLSQGSTLL